MKNWRINILLLPVVVVAATLIGCLAFYQIERHEFYLALARGQQQFLPTLRAERGDIFFQSHQLPLATDKAYYYLHLSPVEIPVREKEKAAKALSEITELDQDLIFQRMQKSTLYEPLKYELTEEEIKAIKELGIKGVYVGQGISRFYPQDNFASHILGFVNREGFGQYGAEERWDEILRQGRGSDIVLTVDYNIQYQAEKLLEKAKEQLDIEGGTIIVMEPGSGKIMALAQWPSFNPNQYAKEEMAIFKLDASQKIFEPGSSFKPITMAAALDREKLTPHTTYKDPGVIHVGGWPIRNYEQRTYPGDITMIEVLEKSINTGAVFALNQLGNKDFAEYIEKFGVFEKTGIDLKGEIAPLNTEFRQGRDINFATASYGQGIEMTPLQLARAFAVIANDGKMVRPFLREGTETETSQQVISQKAAGQTTAMLVSVVEKGWARAAKIPGYYVAGKTGTSQISYSALAVNKKGYSDKTWQSFVGFAPAFDPQFLILVKLDNPKARTAEYSALPLFRDLAKYIIDYKQIPPDYE